MSYRDKLEILKNQLTSLKSTNQSLCQSTNTNLAVFDDDLDLLLADQTSPMDLMVTSMSNPIHLIIMLDISGSMIGTENDIYDGLRELLIKHRNNNVLLTMVLFNGESHLLYDKDYIGNVHTPELEMTGSTNLNGTLYYTLRNRCKTGINLGIVISDGEDTVEEIPVDTVRKMMTQLDTPNNHFYFLGEPYEHFKPTEVLSSARRLGFKDNNISIFTRSGSGNKINFEVISQMLEELLSYGTISDNWSEPIKENYLALTDGRNR